MKLLAGALFFAMGLSSVLGTLPPSHSADQCPNTSLLLRTFRLTVTCNITTLKEKQLKDIQAPVTNLYLPILYLLAFSVGLPSNIMVLWVLVFRTNRLPSMFFLINLTIADCLLLLVLPFRIVYHFRDHQDLLAADQLSQTSPHSDDLVQVINSKQCRESWKTSRVVDLEHRE